MHGWTDGLMSRRLQEKRLTNIQLQLGGISMERLLYCFIFFATDP